MMSDNPVRVRIAPSPTGDPHVGTAYVALLNLAFARKHNGQFVLRIEDTDRERSAEKYEQKIFEGLRWLNLEWDEGPDKGGTHAPYRQSEREELYRNHAKTLLEKGKAYKCFCSSERLKRLRERQKEEGKDIGYDGKCRSLSQEEIQKLENQDEPFVVRLKVPNAGSTSFEDQVRGTISLDNDTIDDQILLKSDGFPTYHLANVVDDHHMEITHVMRAEEWISSTPKHILLYEAFGWEPPVFAHLPLLRNKDKSKISKRQNPVSILWYREHGFLPDAVCNFLSLMGFSMPDEQEIYSLGKLREEFSFDRLRTTAPVFDMDKLKWLNGKYIRQLEEDELARRLSEGGFCPAEPEDIKPIVPLIQERLKTLEDVDHYADFFFHPPENYDPEQFLEHCESLDEAVTILNQLKSLVQDVSSFEDPDFEDQLRELPGQLDVSGAALFMSLRLAVTGKAETPPIMDCLKQLGKKQVGQHLDHCISQLSNA